MNSSARLSAILERLANGESVAVADLIDELATSLATIRRDLAMPERPRLLARADDGVAHGHHDLPRVTRRTPPR
jgi:DeoR/GlpR family transcriptional regulator of sugar metabolism